MLNSMAISCSAKKEKTHLSYSTRPWFLVKVVLCEQKTSWEEATWNQQQIFLTDFWHFIEFISTLMSALNVLQQSCQILLYFNGMTRLEAVNVLTTPKILKFSHSEIYTICCSMIFVWFTHHFVYLFLFS